MDTCLGRISVAEKNIETEFCEWVDRLEVENEGLRDENSRLTEQVMMLDSMLSEFRQALADSQLALAKSNAQLRLANQPTA
ncbi:hypothetical protein D3C74_445250 [compost metagenome]